MVPSTETSIIAFVLLALPGIVFELLWQRTRPRRDESAFVEISRVLLTGVVFTGLATVIVVLLAVVSGTAVSVVDLVREGPEYLTRNPALAVSSAVTEVLLAICFAVVGHDLITPPGMRRIAQETEWQTAFGRPTTPPRRTRPSATYCSPPR